MIYIWNRAYDKPRLEHVLGIRIPMEATRDAMDMFHVLYNAFKRKLGFATSMMPSSWRLRMWKHLSQTEPAYYSTVDSIALQRNAIDGEQLLDETGARPVWDLLHVRLDPALDHMSRSGMLVDLKVRDDLRTELRANLDSLIKQMNDAVPEEIRSPKVWKSFGGAVKGKMTLITNAKKDGEYEEAARLEVAPLFTLLSTRKSIQCSRCGQQDIKADHVTRKFIKAETKEAPSDSSN